MQKTLLTLLLTTVSFSFIVAAIAETPGNNDLQALFEDADILKDGKLDKGEFDIFHFRSFNRLDADKDDVLLSDECTGDCFSGRLWPRYGRADKQENRDLADTIRKYEFQSAPYRFESMDTDGNGQLSIDEYVKFGRERFTNFDNDKDDAISASEFCSGYNSSMPCDFKDQVQLEPSAEAVSEKQ